MKKRLIPIIVLLALAGAGATFGLHARQDGKSGPLTLYGNVDIRAVNLSFRVGGRLTALNADEGDAIEAGQILGEIDRAPFENALAEAEASVSMRKANLTLLEAGYRAEEIAQARSELINRTAAYEYAEQYYQRQAGLLHTNAISVDQADNAKTSRDQARASMQAARDKVLQYEAGYRPEEIAAAKASLSQAEASLSQAKLNLADATLASPSEGTILTRVVEPGTVLAAGSAVFTLSLTRPVWIRAYVDETNLGRAVPGKQVSVATDARPGRPYTGNIGFVSPTAEFTPKSVQTPELRTNLVYRLRIIVADPDDALRQGMPATITIPE